MRTDLRLIADMVATGSKVLDVGCGKGELLEYLAEQRGVDGRGLEISQTGVSACVKNGIPAIQGDADHDLVYYADKSFDYIISTQTIQATYRPKLVLQEMLRIGRHVIISVPNFGYWYNRFYLAMRGRMPVSETLSYEWYDTPNIHFCTIRDFLVLCNELNCEVKKSFYVNRNGEALPFQGNSMLVNLFGEHGIFLLSGK